jgi:hypothetical protein
MPRATVLAALGVSASLIMGSLIAAAPADAATHCHDSHAVRHAKHVEQRTLSSDRAMHADDLRSAKAQLRVDRDQAANDNADSGTTRAEKDLDAADVARDEADVIALSKAMSWDSKDRTYFGRCGKSILVRGKRRTERHVDQFIIASDRASLAVATAELEYDRQQLDDARATDDPTAEDEARSAMADDQTFIDNLNSDIARRTRQLAKL